jgi:Flp pilus assembly pilin Flp
LQFVHLIKPNLKAVAAFPFENGPNRGNVMIRFGTIVRLKEDVRGSTAVEFCLICGLIIIGLLSAFNGVADEVDRMWGDVNSKSQEAMDGS